MDVEGLWAEIAHDGHLWALCGIAMVLGIVGGVAQGFASAEDGRPSWRTLVQRGLLGAVAAGAVLYLAKPDSGIALVSGSLVAGYTGQALLDALAARAKLKVSEERVAVVTRQIVAQAEEQARLRVAMARVETLLDGGAPDALRARTDEARALLRTVSDRA